MNFDVPVWVIQHFPNKANCIECLLKGLKGGIDIKVGHVVRNHGVGPGHIYCEKHAEKVGSPFQGARLSRKARKDSR